MSGVLLKIHNRTSKELEVASELCCLLIQKPLQRLEKEPDWENCINISTPYENRELSLESELKPILNNAIGMLAHKNKKPIELGLAILARESGELIWVLFVKIEERLLTNF